MAYCFIELRHYSSAINCLNECEKEAGDLIPDVFLRRAQARMYKKNITKEELELAEKDLEKSIYIISNGILFYRIKTLFKCNKLFK